MLDEVAALIRAMHEQDMLDRKTTIRMVDRFEGIVVPEQPFCCPECGCREYRVICGMKDCSWCQGKGGSWVGQRGLLDLPEVAP